MKNLLLALTVLCLFSCAGPDKKSNINDSLSADTTRVDTSTKKQADTAAKKDEAPDSKWVYTEQEDKMTSKKRYFAAIDANELLEFDFPYNGGVTATLTIRRQGGLNEALLTVSKGQFITDIDGTTVKIRIDEGPAIAYSASGPSDSSTEVLFINNANKLINKLKTAKKVLIQAEFYQSGNKVMEFDVAGFKWAH